MGQRTVVSVGAVPDRVGLVRSLTDHRPAPAPVIARTVRSVAVVVPLALLAWFVLGPLYITQTESDLPSSVDLLRDACKGAGISYTSATRYGGPAPHPVAVFTESDDGWQRSDVDRTGPVEWNPGSPKDVQLLACARLVGSSSNGKRCHYREVTINGVRRDGAVLPQKIAHYRLDVYELRTYRRVASFRVDGDDATCPGLLSTDVDTVYTFISNSTLINTLRGLVTG
jgi:hypothetical protein